MLSDKLPLESLLRPIGAVTIHAFSKGTFCFAYVLLATLSARDKVDAIYRFSILRSAS